jgi:hypothetical protein
MIMKKISWKSFNEFLICCVTFILAIILLNLVTLTSFNRENSFRLGFFSPVIKKAIVSTGTVDTKSMKNLDLRYYNAVSFPLNTYPPVIKS